MNYLENAKFTDALRMIHQIPELLLFDGDPRNGNQPTSFQTIFFLTTKIGITALDTYASFLRRDPTASVGLKITFNIAEAGFRVIDLFRGIYLLHTDPSIDKDYMTPTILCNCLNISRLFMDTLKLTNVLPSQSSLLGAAALTFSITDGVIKHGILNKLPAFGAAGANRWNQISHLMNQIYQYLLVHRVDSIVRSLLTSLIAGLYSIKAKRLCQRAFENKENWKPFLMIPLLTAALTPVLRPGYHDIFGRLGVPQNPVTQMHVVDIGSVLTAAVIASASAVALGFSKSLKDIAMNSYPMVVTAALTYSVGYFLYSFLQANNLNPQVALLQRNHPLGKWHFTIVGSLAFSSVLAYGFGLTQSISDYLRIVQLALSSLAIGGSIMCLRKVSRNDALDWSEIFLSLLFAVTVFSDDVSLIECIV